MGEGAFVYVRHTLGNDDGRKAYAPVESVRTDVGHLIRECDRRKSGTAVEGFGSNRCDVCGNGHRGEVGATGE